MAAEAEKAATEEPKKSIFSVSRTRALNLLAQYANNANGRVSPSSLSKPASPTSNSFLPLAQHGLTTPS